MLTQHRSHEPFAPTHTAPAVGMDTWSEPGGPAAGQRLDPYLPVRLLRAYGDWAQVLCSNGWTAWVDGRALMNPAAYAQAQRSAQGRAPSPGRSERAAGGVLSSNLPAEFVMPSMRTWPVSAGTALVLVATLLPWIDVGGSAETSHAFDVPAAFLFSKNNVSSGGPKVGVVLLLLAVTAFVFRHLPKLEKLAAVPAGMCVAAVTMFIVQLNALLGTAEAGSAPSLLDTVGIGTWAALVGAGLLSWGAKRR